MCSGARFDPNPDATIYESEKSLINDALGYIPGMPQYERRFAKEKELAAQKASAAYFEPLGCPDKKD